MDERDRRYADLRAADGKAVDAALAAAKEAVAAALASAERAVEKAENNAEKWRMNANEWRGAMNDRERTLMPRAETEARLAALEKTTNRGEGRIVGATNLWGVIITAIVAAIAVASFFLHR